MSIKLCQCIANRRFKRCGDFLDLVLIVEADDGSHRRKELVAVGRWVAPEGNKFGATPGSVSWGVWINQFPVGVYRMHGPPLSRFQFPFTSSSSTTADRAVTSQSNGNSTMEHCVQGELKAYRFDALEVLSITHENVHFKDLLLDAWIKPIHDASNTQQNSTWCSSSVFQYRDMKFSIQKEDEDEMAEAIARGIFNRQQQTIATAVNSMLDNPEKVRVLLEQVDSVIYRAIMNNEDILAQSLCDCVG